LATPYARRSLGGTSAGSRRISSGSKARVDWYRHIVDGLTLGSRWRDGGLPTPSGRAITNEQRKVELSFASSFFAVDSNKVQRRIVLACYSTAVQFVSKQSDGKNTICAREISDAKNSVVRLPFDQFGPVVSEEIVHQVAIPKCIVRSVLQA